MEVYTWKISRINMPSPIMMYHHCVDFQKAYTSDDMITCSSKFLSKKIGKYVLDDDGIHAVISIEKDTDYFYVTSTLYRPTEKDDRCRYVKSKMLYSELKHYIEAHTRTLNDWIRELKGE